MDETRSNENLIDTVERKVFSCGSHAAASASGIRSFRLLYAMLSHLFVGCGDVRIALRDFPICTFSPNNATSLVFFPNDDADSFNWAAPHQ